MIWYIYTYIYIYLPTCHRLDYNLKLRQQRDRRRCSMIRCTTPCYDIMPTIYIYMYVYTHYNSGDTMIVCTIIILSSAYMIVYNHDLYHDNYYDNYDHLELSWYIIMVHFHGIFWWKYTMNIHPMPPQPDAFFL